MRFPDSGRRTQAIKFEGVRWGSDDEESVVGVAVPESGYAGEGACERVDSLREERIPERMAMPSVPCEDQYIASRQGIISGGGGLTASQDR